MNDPPISVIEKAVAARRRWAIDTLADLVRCPTTLHHEESGQHQLANLFETLGYSARMEPIDVGQIRNHPGFSPVDWTLHGKKNLVAVHDPGAVGGKSVIFNGHIDVVSPEPTALWTSPPFEPRVDDGDNRGETWMYGRGAGDMKGGTVSYLWALAALQDLGLEPASRVICQSPVEEECTGNGTLSLLARGYTADACVIPEPFDQTLLECQLGVIWFQIRVRGRTTHVLGAGRGVNAIEKSWVMIRAMRDLEETLNRQIPKSYAHLDHPINLNVGVIRGGDWASTVAGECVTRFRLALFPGHDVDNLRQKIESDVDRAAAADPWLRDHPPRVEYVGFRAEGCVLDLDNAFGHTLQAAHSQCRGESPDRLAATCTTDARFFSLYFDTPVTCYGPRAYDIHGIDERVSVDSMQSVACVLAEFVKSWCGLKKRAMPRRAHP